MDIQEEVKAKVFEMLSAQSTQQVIVEKKAPKVQTNIIAQAIVGFLAFSISACMIVAINKGSEKKQVFVSTPNPIESTPEPFTPLTEENDEVTLREQIAILEEKIVRLGTAHNENVNRMNDVDKKYHQGSGNNYIYINKNWSLSKPIQETLDRN